MDPWELSFWGVASLIAGVMALASRRLHRSGIRVAIQLVAFLIAGVGVNELSYASYFGPVGESAGVFWLSSGLLVGVLLSVSKRYYLLFVLVGIAIHLISGRLLHAQSWDATIFWMSANVLEGVVGSLLLRGVLGHQPDITQPRGFMLYCLLCVAIATAISAAIGVATIVLIYGGENMLRDWQVWTFSNAMGMLSLGTALLTWHTRVKHVGRPRGWRRVTEALVLTALIIVVTWVTIGPYDLTRRSVLDYPYLVLPLLVWAALRFDARYTTTAAIYVAIVTVFTANGTLGQFAWINDQNLGPFSKRGVSVGDVVLSIQAFLFVTLFATQLLVAMTHQRLRAERERTDLRDQLYESQRMESIAQLAAGVAHDLNNLLAVISAYREQVENRVGDDPDIMPALQAMDYATENATTLSRSLLDLKRHDESLVGPFNLGDLVNQAIQVCKPLLPNTIRLTNETTANSDLTIFGDRNQLQQVVLNLLLNARDAMSPGGGRLNVWVRQVQGKPGVVELSVKDTGCGIAPMHLPHVFEPLFTTKPQGQGTGLGLTIVRSIVEELGGSVQIESSVGVGTTIRVELPLDPDTAHRSNDALHRTGIFVINKEESMAAPTQPPATNAGRTALVLINNPQISGAIISELIVGGWTVHRCVTLEEYDQAVETTPRPVFGLVDLRAYPQPEALTQKPLPIPTLVLFSGDTPPVLNDPRSRTIRMPVKVRLISETLADMG